MNVTRRGLLGLAALGAGSLALSACQSGDKGAQAGNVTAQASLAPGDDYSKDDSGRSATYQTKGRELLAGLGSFETICQPRVAQGRVEQLTYQTHSYVWEEANPGQEFLVSKVINVWLPADYDASRTYDVLYLMHGTGHEGPATGSQTRRTATAPRHAVCWTAWLKTASSRTSLWRARPTTPSLPERSPLTSWPTTRQILTLTTGRASSGRSYARA